MYQKEYIKFHRKKKPWRKKWKVKKKKIIPPPPVKKKRKKRKKKKKVPYRFKKLRFNKAHASLEEPYLNEIKEIRENTFHSLRCYALELIINWDIFAARESKSKRAQGKLKRLGLDKKKLES